MIAEQPDVALVGPWHQRPKPFDMAESGAAGDKLHPHAANVVILAVWHIFNVSNDGFAQRYSGRWLAVAGASMTDVDSSESRASTRRGRT